MKISEEDAAAMVERFRNGTTSLKEERARLGIGYNDSIRAALKRLVGPEEYRRLIAASRTKNGKAAPA